MIPTNPEDIFTENQRVKLQMKNDQKNGLVPDKDDPQTMEAYVTYMNNLTGTELLEFDSSTNTIKTK